MPDKPLVSIVIPTHKGDKILEHCLKAIEFSTYKNLEVIVINEGLERSAQRNIGINRAKGKYLLILDSDQLITPNLIGECVNKIGDNAGVYIPEKIITKGFFGYLRNWERQFYTGTPIDVVRFVKKSCPLFDETMSGPEDSDWDRRIEGTRVTSINMLYHFDNIGFFKYLSKKAYYSKSMWKFSEKHPNDKCLNFWWRCLGVFIEDGKWKRCLQAPHLFVCLVALIGIRGVIYKCTSSS